MFGKYPWERLSSRDSGKIAAKSRSHEFGPNGDQDPE